MEYRKIIKFGNSSHVVSLPNEWLRRNKLNKGDTIYFEENGDSELTFTPKLTKNEREFKEININTKDKEIERIRREIISAYLNDHNTIKISGENVRKYEGEIKDAIRHLMALEIIEQGNNFIIAKDFLDLQSISIDTIIRKMDNILRSMMDDIINSDKNTNFLQISSRDFDVNRLMYLGVRILRASLKDPNLGKSLKIASYETFEYRSIINNIERIADHAKRFAKYLDKIKKEDKENFAKILAIYSKVVYTYENAMKSYYNKDIELAYSLSFNKKNIADECTALYDKVYNKKNIPIILENLKDTISETHDIIRRVYS
ncbi:MAG TPA: PhoU domain-containing protein [Candidatus Nanoarchaeia archaeon]|nr:PhoU domain-containing protein [Candidatus Nanoarchaeia archaeon]